MAEVVVSLEDTGGMLGATKCCEMVAVLWQIQTGFCRLSLLSRQNGCV